MKRKIKAAGVLPYSKDADGNTWFLLGREKPNASWGVDSASWSEFGGSLDAGETVEQGAAREFFEETMGCVTGDPAWMEYELCQGRYLLGMDSKTPSGKGYRSFVKYVPFVDYPARFARFKTLARHQPEVVRALAPKCFQRNAKSFFSSTTVSSQSMIPTCAEKTSMGWFSVDQMRRAVEKYKRDRHHGDGRQGGRDASSQHAYYEPDMVPHIRRGFAMDFDHLIHNTSWGRDNFRNDHLHFPLELELVQTDTAVGATSTSRTRHDSNQDIWRPVKSNAQHDFDVIKTASGKFRPLIKTPSAKKPPAAQAGHAGQVGHAAQAEQAEQAPLANRLLVPRPPVVEVSTKGYSFKKRKRRRNKDAKASHEKQQPWIKRNAAVVAEINDTASDATTTTTNNTTIGVARKTSAVTFAPSLAETSTVSSTTVSSTTSESSSSRKGWVLISSRKSQRKWRSATLQEKKQRKRNYKPQLPTF